MYIGNRGNGYVVSCAFCYENDYEIVLKHVSQHYTETIVWDLRDPKTDFDVIANNFDKFIEFYKDYDPSICNMEEK